MPNQYTNKMTDDEKKESRRRSLKKYHEKKLADPAKREKHYANFTNWRKNFRESDPAGYERWSRDKDLRKNYGITLEQYESMCEAQNGACTLCGVVPSESGGRLVVDHSHKTKKVRSLLCSKCNLGIGQLKENIDVLYKAISYLKEHN